MSDGLEVISPTPVEVNYQNERLEIRPLTIGRIPDFVRAVRPILSALVALKQEAEDGELLKAFDTIVALMEEDGEKLYLAAAIAIGREKEWVAKGFLDEFVDLVQAILKVNGDFFVRRLLPMLRAAARAKADENRGPESGAGKTTSNTSKNEDTATPSS